MYGSISPPHRSSSGAARHGRRRHWPSPHSGVRFDSPPPSEELRTTKACHRRTRQRRNGSDSVAVFTSSTSRAGALSRGRSQKGVAEPPVKPWLFGPEVTPSYSRRQQSAHAGYRSPSSV